MNRIDLIFKDKSTKKLFPFIPAGYPDISTTENLIYELADNGADLIELGVPFSDPIADGPIIQEASHIALLGGINLDKIFTLVEKVRKNGVDVPIVLMSYFNPIFRYGLQNVAEKAKLVGVDGFIIPDLLPFATNDKKEFSDILKEHEIHQIFLASIITEHARLKNVVKATGGFLYLISRLGVTGETDKLDLSPIENAIKKIRSFSEVPVAIGFGISNKEQVKHIKDLGDAVIVGSSVTKHIKEGNVGDFIKELKSVL